MLRTEVITRALSCPTLELAPGVELRVLVAGSLGSQGLTTCLARFQPAAELPFHHHPCSEVIIALSGEANVQVEDRRYRLRPYDAIHVPALIAHRVSNYSKNQETVLHTSFATGEVTREPVPDTYPVRDREASDPNSPETLVGFERAPVYELAPRAHFRDLFAKRFGSRGICGGYGLFQPGASLPCHYHLFDESITIVTGKAVCQVAGKTHELSDCDTACVPRERPHRFLNLFDQPMAMIWVYAGDEPERTLVDAGYCEGSLTAVG